MNGGSKFFASAAVLALAGCGGSEPELQIRSTPTPLSATAKPVPFRIAEANGHLALGNVALALESYRKALREQPDSVEAMVGLADCYERMARFDLSRRYYEEALAIVPTDTRVLTALARSLDAQGHADEATAVRQEIALRLAAAARSPKPEIMALAPSPKLALRPATVFGPSVTVTLPAPKPMIAEPKKAAAPPARPAKVRQAAAPKPKPVQQAIAAPIPMPRPVAPAPVAARVMAAKPEPVGQRVAASIAVLQPAAPTPVVVAPVVAAKPMPVQPLVAAPIPAPPRVATAPVPPPVMAAKPKPMQPLAAAPVYVPPKVAPVPAVPPRAIKPSPIREAVADLAPGTVSPVTVAVPAPKLAAAAVEIPRTPMPSTSASAAARIDPSIRVVEPTAARPGSSPVAIARSALAASPSVLNATTRLERLSPGEVVLVTSGKPQWRSQIASRTAHSTTIRYVPLRTAQQRMAQARTVNIRLLNAARYRGLAARTQKLLANRGWRQLAIGDATRVRRTSLILYPANRRATAERLAKQFGFPIEKRASGNEFVMLLGRDAQIGSGTGG